MDGKERTDNEQMTPWKEGSQSMVKGKEGNENMGVGERGGECALYSLGCQFSSKPSQPPDQPVSFERLQPWLQSTTTQRQTEWV